ncbi:hypothetical protein DFH11DRAFT_910955 [Phellopilus nigrolimitatus]|nr:hypothetical protein DFH11DRAFT_910955 [Phellopilus nigrolimitatus]
MVDPDRRINTEAAKTKVATLLDVLQLIFRCSAKSDLSHCARVCKLWSGIALDELWRKLCDLKPLFSILAPIEIRETGVSFELAVTHARIDVNFQIHQAKQWWHFSGALEPETWTRFYQYANRIRDLDLSIDRMDWPSTRMITEISVKRPSAHFLLPRLDDLTLLFFNDDHLAILLMSESLASVNVRLPDDDQFRRLFLKELAMRSPRLKSLQLSRHFSHNSISSLARMTDLRKIVLPKYTLNSTIADALAALPHLHTIDFSKFPDDDATSLDDVRGFSPSPLLQEGAYSSLTNLSLACEFSELVKLMKRPIAPSLSYLRVQTLHLETADSLHELLVSLSETRSSLTGLSLEMIPEFVSVESGFGIPYEFGEMQPVDLMEFAEDGFRTTTRDERGETLPLGRIFFRTLEPLSGLPNLRQLIISYHQEFLIKNDEFVRLISHLPHIDTLRFNCDPMLIGEQSDLDFGVLPIVATLLPRLRFLGLYISHRHEPYAQHKCKCESVAKGLFSKLESIDFGCSIILEKTDCMKIAFHLSKILPLTCKL